MKSEQTKRLIKESFAELLDERPINEISINDIAEKSGVNRNTIYYHFKNIPDLFESIAKDMVDRVITEHPPTYESLEDCLMAAIKMVKDNEKIVYHTFNSPDRRIFERHLWHILEYTISSFMDSFEPMDEGAIGGEVTEEEREVMKNFLKFECYGFMMDWVNHGMPEGVEQKVKVLMRFVAGRGGNFGQMSKN